MRKVLIVVVCLLSWPSLAEIPMGVEVFKRPGLASPMEIRTERYRFTIENIDGVHFIKAEGFGTHIAHEVRDGGVKNVRRLFVVESHACGESFVDLVLQMDPSRNEESPRRSYYRIVFSSDLGRTVSEFYDPSVAAVHAVLPLQNVEGLEEPDLGGKILCDGATPEVIYPEWPGVSTFGSPNVSIRVHFIRTRNLSRSATWVS